MAQRIIKNYTSSDYTLTDLGDLVIPNHGSLDIGGAEARLIEIASSDSALAALAQGIDKFQINDGSRDYEYAEGIDLLRRISSETEKDQLNRWIVRSDSRRKNYDTAFTGKGDNLTNSIIGGGTDLRFDFSAANTDSRWITAPTGYKRQQINWNYMDAVYIKEGSIYFFNAPKGAYIDMYFVIPAGYPYYKKVVDTTTFDASWENNYTTATADTIIGHWVVNHWVEGSCPMGDYLNTEAAHESPSPSYVIYRAEITAPEDATDLANFHGHFSIELYRGRTIIY